MLNTLFKWVKPRKKEVTPTFNTSIKTLDLITQNIKECLGENLVRYTIYREAGGISVRAVYFKICPYKIMTFMPVVFTYNLKGEQINQAYYGMDTWKYDNVMQWMEYKGKPFLRRTEMWEDKERIEWVSTVQNEK